MSVSAQRLLTLIHQRQPVSGAQLASELGVSRNAVWKHVESLRGLGVPVIADKATGYQLEHPFLSFQDDVLGQLAAPTPIVLDSVDSTNRWLRSEIDRPSGTAVLAESQVAGRGRRGRTWSNTAYADICLSLLWEFSLPISRLAGLSVAVGVSVLRALHQQGFLAEADRLSLKWPNDLLFSGKKLGGILVDVAGEMEGPAKAIIGIGINGYKGESQRESIDQPVADLVDAGFDLINRSALAVSLINQLRQDLPAYEIDGLASFMSDWQRWDALENQSIQILEAAGNRTSGIARGIDSSGALLVERDGSISPLVSGEVSVRRQ